MTIYFDMDGTIANLYGVENWLEMLQAHDPTPYRVAAPMLNMSQLARRLNQLQNEGHRLGIISWLAKNSDPSYDEKVRRAKRRWLAEHLPSVDFDEIHLVKYGTYKTSAARDNAGILFDDEPRHRKVWRGESYEPSEIMAVLTSL